MDQNASNETTFDSPQNASMYHVYQYTLGDNTIAESMSNKETPFSHYANVNSHYSNNDVIRKDVVQGEDEAKRNAEGLTYAD